MKRLIKILTTLFLLMNGLAFGETDTSVLYSGSDNTNKYVYKDTTYPGGKGWKPGSAKYGFEIVEDVKIPMDDGIILNATVAYPTDLKTGKRMEGKFPVVVEHMPYEQFRAPVRINTYFTEHGYISLFVRARGTGKSQGEVQFLSAREGQDGKNIVDWAAYKLEGSDGRIALMGCSWPGAIALTDTAYAGKNSPLKAVVASASGLGNMHTQSWIIGGMPSMSIWQFKARGTQLVGDTPAVRRFFDKVSNSVLSGGDLAYEREYWGQRESLSLAEKIVENDIPVLLYAGWKDIVETGTIRAYTALQNAYAGRPVGQAMVKGQKTSPHYQIIMGGWAHGEGLDMGLLLQWFDTWVKGEDTGIQNTETPMHAFESGTNRWLNLKGFTEVEEATQLRLGTNLTLGENLENGENTLKYTQPDEIGGKLTYTTNPFKDGATISGAMSVTIYAKSNNQNIVLIGHLYDVAPDGKEELITRGAMIGSLRELNKNYSWIDKNGVVIWPWLALKKDSLLKPNQTYKFDLALAPRQYGIKPGHSLKLEITTQTSKKLGDENGIPLTNDTEPWGLTKTQEKTVPGGEYKILFGEKTPSTLNLSLLPYEYFKEVKSGKLSVPWNEGLRRIQEPEGNPVIFTLPLEW